MRRNEGGAGGVVEGVEHWHLSREPLTVGGALEARPGEGHYAFLTLRLPGGDVTVEDFLERHRPEGKPSRKACWFMCSEIFELYHASPGEADAGVHLVELEPREPSRHHFGWIAAINDIAFPEEELTEEEARAVQVAAEKYWSGEDLPEDLMRGHYGWEVLSTVVTVIDCGGMIAKGSTRFMLTF